MFKNNPLFSYIIVFFQRASFLLQLLCFAENTIKIVFSEEPHKQNPLRTARGPARGAFFQFWGWFFLGEDWLAQMHSGTLLSSTTLHAQSRKLVQMCLRKCSDPNPGTQVCPNFKRLLLQQVHGPSATLSSVCQNFSRGYHVESFEEKIKNCAQNDIGEFHLSRTRNHRWWPRTLPGACPLSVPLRGPLEGKSSSRLCNKNTVFMRKWY